MKRAVVLLTGAVLPKQYFRPKEPDVRDPKAPWWALLAAYACEILALLAMGSFFVYYFSTLATPTTVISPAILPKASCLALAPKTGTAYYSKLTSENAQFAKNSQTSADCVAMLNKAQVCSDAHRLDVISVLGVTNPANPQYYPPTSTGSQGYFSFTPSQRETGLVTHLVPFYVTGKAGVSVSFPKPAVSEGQVFEGTSSNWNVYNFAKNASKNAFTLYRDVSASTLLYDAKAQHVYDLEQQKDYDLSRAAINSTSIPGIGTLKSLTSQFLIPNLTVHDGTYYSLRAGVVFNGPESVAVDAAGNVYIADKENNLVRKIDATTQEVESLGTSASPAFKKPTAVAVDSAGHVYVADSGNKLVRMINATTQEVESLGISANPAFLSPTGIAVDAAGAYVYVADSDTNQIYRINVKTQAVETLGSPAFKKPTAVAVDSAGHVYVADNGNSLVRKIDATTQEVESLGISANPAFLSPTGIAVDAAGAYVYVADSYTNLVRKIDVQTQAVTSLGTSASPAFKTPRGVAVDAAGTYVYVADTGNNVIHKIDKTQAVTRFVGSARVFSWDMRNPDPRSFALWPNADARVVDSAAGGCQNVVVGADGSCYLLAHAEYNAETRLIYLEFQQFSDSKFWGVYVVEILDPSSKDTPRELVFQYDLILTLQLWGVFKTPANGITLFMSHGAYVDDSNSYGPIPLTSLRGYNGLVTAKGTSIVDVSKIPAVPGSQPQYLMLLLLQNGVRSMYTYDTFTDTYFSNAAAAATTHIMLAFTWGVCNNNVTRSLVELSFSNDYSNECQTPSSGLYYQSPNVYYAIPYACLGIAYDKLLTDCPDIKANMKALVDSTCQASIPKVCAQQYELNPPFSCVTNVYPTAFSVISLAASNTLALYGFTSLLFALVLNRIYHKYRASPRDARVLSPRTKRVTLVKNFLFTCCGMDAKRIKDEDEEEEAEEARKEEGKSRLGAGAGAGEAGSKGEGEGGTRTPGRRRGKGRDRSGSGDSDNYSGDSGDSDSSSEASWSALPQSAAPSNSSSSSNSNSAAAAIETYLDHIMCGLGGSGGGGGRRRRDLNNNDDDDYNDDDEDDEDVDMQPPLDLEAAQTPAALREQFARLRALEDRLQRQSSAMETRQGEMWEQLEQRQRLSRRCDEERLGEIHQRVGEMERLVAGGGAGEGAGRGGASGRRI